jgi:hypothetical protein
MQMQNLSKNTFRFVTPETKLFVANHPKEKPNAHTDNTLLRLFAGVLQLKELL